MYELERNFVFKIGIIFSHAGAVAVMMLPFPRGMTIMRQSVFFWKFTQVRNLLLTRGESESYVVIRY